LQNQVYPGKVVKILPLKSERGDNFRLMLENGESLVARRVVLATNYGKVQLPDWVTQIPSPYPSEKLCHSTKINLPTLHLQGEKILNYWGRTNQRSFSNGSN